jgi:hypothetical protein
MNSFFSTSEQITPADDHSFDLARQLYNRLSESRRVFRKHILSKWAKEIEILLTHFEKEEIEKVIAWYAQHWNDEYMPQAYSAKGFVDKFGAIKRLFDSQNSSQASVEDRILEKEQKATDRRQSILDRLKAEGKECTIE